jgi:hypothetical protein
LFSFVFFCFLFFSFPYVFLQLFVWGSRAQDNAVATREGNRNR